MTKVSIAEKIIHFNKSLEGGVKIPNDFQLLNPFKETIARTLSEQFYRKFYTDEKKRVFILGINPGRFGAGTTGIPFTDPINLEKFCRIPNDLKKRHELSSIFVYEVINAFGGPRAFYKHYLITAVCPLGFTRDGRNINYYDDIGLLKSVEPFIIQTLQEQINFGASRKIALILGEGKNYKYFSALNNKLKFFEELVPLAHPRFILQYKRKMMDDYVNQYLETLKKTISRSNI